MKFYELKKGQAFYFADRNKPAGLCLCAGMGLDNGKFVSSWSDVDDAEEWLYCPPDCEVVPE